MGKFFMTDRSGADSGNDDKKEDGVWACSPSGVHGQRIGMKP